MPVWFIKGDSIGFWVLIFVVQFNSLMHVVDKNKNKKAQDTCLND